MSDNRHEERKEKDEARPPEETQLSIVDIYGPLPGPGPHPAPARLPAEKRQSLPAIGTAEILNDETIILHLRAESADGTAHGDGEYRVQPKDSNYTSIRDHIGEIQKGEIKFVSPWTDNTGQPTNSGPARGEVAPKLEPEPPKTDTPKTDTPKTDGTAGDTSTIVPDTGTATGPAAGKPVVVPVPIVPPSQQFTTEVNTTYNAMSPETRAIIARSGAKVVAVHHLTDAMPELKGQSPRGWPKGATWDAVDGCWSTSKNFIVVAEERQSISNNSWLPSGRVKEVLRHETGHAVDFTIRMLSDQKDFKQAYDEDVLAMPAADKPQLSYFLQAGDAGREETAAEGVADREGGATGGAAFHRDFPKTLAVINNTIKIIGGSTGGNPIVIPIPGLPAGGSGTPTQTY